MDIYNKNMCVKSVCYPSVREGIDYLKEKNFIIGCVTNKNGRFVRPIIEKLGLIYDVRIIIAGDTLPKKKSDPLPILHAASFFKTDPKKLLS